MTVSLLLMMVAAILAAVVLYTFIGFIPGTDETSVLAMRPGCWPPSLWRSSWLGHHRT